MKRGFLNVVFRLLNLISASSTWFAGSSTRFTAPSTCFVRRFGDDFRRNKDLFYLVIELLDFRFPVRFREVEVDHGRLDVSVPHVFL